MNQYFVKLTYPVVKTLTITCEAIEFGTKVQELFGILGTHMYVISTSDTSGQIRCSQDVGGTLIYGEFQSIIDTNFSKLLFVKRKNINEPSSFRNIDVPMHQLLHHATMIIDDTGCILKNRYDKQGHRVKLDVSKIEFNKLYDMVFETNIIYPYGSCSDKIIITKLANGDYVSNRNQIFLSDFKKPIPDEGFDVRVDNTTVTVYSDGSYLLLIDGKPKENSINFDKGDHKKYYVAIEKVLNDYNIGY